MEVNVFPLIFGVYTKSAAVVELVDTLDLKSNSYYNGSTGSSPVSGTDVKYKAL